MNTRTAWLHAAHGVSAIALACSLLPGLAQAQAQAHDHSAHAASASAERVKRSEVNYTPAAVPLVRQDGKATTLSQVLEDGRPVVLNFIFTSCTAICPVTTQVLSEVASQLGRDKSRVNMLTLSIDPENDTPRKLSAYAQRFGGGNADWGFFTGKSADMVAVQKSFNSYQGDKMNHVPVTFVRLKPGSEWIRYDGFVSPPTLLDELKAAFQKGASPKMASPQANRLSKN